jgi:hypothetical protein
VRAAMAAHEAAQPIGRLFFVRLRKALGRTDVCDLEFWDMIMLTLTTISVTKGHAGHGASYRVRTEFHSYASTMSFNS